MTSNSLVLVSDPREVAAAHITFNQGCTDHRELTRDLVRRTRYWVVDPRDGTFSPSKFSGFVRMDFPRYDLARRGLSTGAKFDGGLTQRAIEAAVGDWHDDPTYTAALRAWVEARFGPNALDGVDVTKWRFVVLKVSPHGGLASLAGGWEGSDELVESLSVCRRDTGRTAPDLR